MKPETAEKRRQRLLDDRPKAWADYESERRATQERTASLRELRLARDAPEAVMVLPVHKIVTPRKVGTVKVRRPFVQGKN